MHRDDYRICIKDKKGAETNASTIYLDDFTEALAAIISYYDSKTFKDYYF